MKKLKGIVLVVLIHLASIMMPFDVYADTISTSNITYNYYLSDVVDSTSQLANKDYIYDVDFLFDKSYLGWVSVSMITSYVYATGDTRQATYTKAIYVNGNTAKTSIVISSNYTGANGSPLSSMSITVNNSNVTPMADLSSLQDIIDILQDIDSLVSIDVMQELENIVANTSLSNQYLETISKYRQYNIPIESYNAIFYSMRNYDPIDFFSYEYISYPIYSVNSNSRIMGGHISNEENRENICILYINQNIYNIATLQQNLNFITTLSGSSITISDFSQLGLTRTSMSSDTFTLIKFKINCNANTWFFIDSLKDIKYIPIYLNYISYQPSTDFALNFGLSNQLLDNLDIIAQGTSQSNSAASDLESSNDQMADDMEDLATIESGYNQQFNNQLQSIDFTSPIQNNAGILPAANFVITIFNGLINNNPFSVLIIVVCILLIGKKVIGK